MTASKEPVVLLDFDGVINAIASFHEVPGSDVKVPPKMLAKLWPQDTWRYRTWLTHNTHWPIKWSTDVVKKIIALRDDGNIDVRWHTTWQHDILPLAKVMGLPELPVQSAPEFDEPEGQLKARLMREGKPGWWKYPAVERLLLSGTTVVWIDDDLTHRTTRWHRDKMAHLGGPFLPLMPDETTGLTPRHFRLLGEFLDKLETSCLSSPAP